MPRPITCSILPKLNGGFNICVDRIAFRSNPSLPFSEIIITFILEPFELLLLLNVDKKLSVFILLSASSGLYIRYVGLLSILSTAEPLLSKREPYL